MAPGHSAIFVSVCGLLLASALAHAADAVQPPSPAAPAKQPPEAGGVRVDMTLEAARNALPSAARRELPSVHTGKTIAVMARGAWTLDGQSYALKLTPRRRSGHATLVIDGQAEGLDVAACRARTLALVAHLNTYFEEIKGPSVMPWEGLLPPPSPKIVATTPPGSKTPVVTGVPNVSTAEDDDMRPTRTELAAGRNARVSETTSMAAKTIWGKAAIVRWTYGQPATKEYPFALDGGATFIPAGPLFAPKTVCRVEAVVEAKPWERPRDDVLAPPLKPKLLSPRDLHVSLDDIELPATPVAFAFRCGVERSGGQLTYCKTKDPTQEKLEMMRAARRRLSKMAFEVAGLGLDPDDDVPLVADVTVVISSADRLSDEAFAALGPSAIVSLAKVAGPVIWAQTASPAEMARYYPPAALEQGIETTTIATCRVANDLSVKCTTVETAPPGLAAFEDATRNIVKHLRAMPKLTTGDPAVGTTVRVPVRFRIED
jgi:Gram-negative bacterial TonB protein C-terminal